MKFTKKILLFVSLFLFPLLAHAQTSPMMHFQGVLVDEGGNVLYDVQEADIVFSIVDGSGEVLFSERQHLVLVSGATAALIGRGERISGDDLIDVFDRPGDKILRVKLDDYPIPQEDAQIVHVPYAMVAERLSSDITTAQIANGTIEQEDLSETLLNYIDNLTGLTEDDLIAHRTESGAHPATSIAVENTFVNTPGTNLQQILQGIDTAIGIRTNQDGVLQDNIDAEARAREEADTEEATARIAGDAALDAAKVNRAGDTMTGDLGFDNATCIANPDLGHDCRLDGVDVSNHNHSGGDGRGVRIAHSNLTGLGNDDHSQYVRDGGDTMTGHLTMSSGANIVMNDDGCDAQDSDIDCLTVDRVDVSSLQDRVRDLEVNTADPPSTAQLTFAWVRTSDVRALPLDGACSSSPLQSSFNIECIQRTGDGGYRIYFERNPTSGGDNVVANSYAVIGSTWGSDADDFVTTVTTRVGWFQIQVWEGTSGERDGSDSDFMIMVLSL